jgi:hypothetical protein
MLHVVGGLRHLLQAVVDAVHGQLCLFYRDRAEISRPAEAGRRRRQVARQAHTLFGRYSFGEKSRTVHWLERLPPKQAVPCRHRAQGIAGPACRRDQGRRQRRPGASRTAARPARVEQGWSTPRPSAQRGGLPRRVVDSTGRRAMASAAASLPRGIYCGSARMTGLQVQADGERAVGGLRQGATPPGKVGTTGMTDSGTDVLGIAAVVVRHVPIIGRLARASR